MIVKLTDIAQSVVLLLDVNVKDVEVKETLLDKPGKVVGKTTKYVKNVFSKDTETTEESQAKTRSVIDFTIKEIATAAGVCYRLDDGELERLTECSSQVEM